MNRQKRGTVLIITLGILTIMAIMGSSFAVLMRTEYEATQNYKLAARAKLIAYDGVVAAGKNLQDMLTYSYYSSLYNDDEDSEMPEYLKLWCYGVDKDDGRYKTDDVTGEYTSIGNEDLLDSFAPVSLPYPYIDTMEEAAYIDFNGDGEYKEEDNDQLLEEPDPESTTNRIFYDETDERPLFSGFPADGRFLGNVDVVAGQQFKGGNRFKLKIFETNSQLSMNYLSSTLYDFLVNADPQTRKCEGSQFKYMLYFLGQGIQKMLETQMREDDPGKEPSNPFNKEVVEALWDLKTSFGDSYEVQQFSAKTQIRSIIEDPIIGNPGYWKYVRDFITISAWPGYNSVYGQFNQNTIVPNINNADAYKTKLGSYDSGTPLASTRGKMTAINMVQRVQPPVDCNTATIPVLYSTIANVSGDARFWYFSPNLSGDNPDSGGNSNESFFAGDSNDPDDPNYIGYIQADELARARRIVASDAPTLATNGEVGSADSNNYYYKRYGDIADIEKKINQFDQFDFIYGEANGDTLFSRNYQLLQYLNISPFRTVWDANEINNDDYAFNFARVIDEMRPFKGWADFDKRVIQDIILNPDNNGNDRGIAKINGSPVPICEPFQSFWHPWNKSGLAPDASCDIDQEYLEDWYYEAVADLIRANFNPTPKITKWNPDATYYQKIDRSDLVYWTVPFIFNNPGIFEVTSVGEIIGQVFDAEKQDYVPKPIIQKQYQAIIKVADVIRHHSQKDFVTGFPAHWDPFDPETPEDYSVVRLYSNEEDGNKGERFSNLTTYPQPINEDIKYSHIKGHFRLDRDSIPPNQAPNQWERTYYTGFHSTSSYSRFPTRELLYGTYTPNALPVGYITVRPQDTGPFDYEMRIDSNGNYMGTPNNIQNTAYYPTGGAGAPAALDIAKDNDPNRNEGAWLNFWMPFNETYDTIGKAQGSSIYGNMKTNAGDSFQSARIGSEENGGRSGDYEITSSRGLVWNASGYTFRYYDLDTSDKYPAYLKYPAGVGFVNGDESDLVQRSNSVKAEDIIAIMPHEELQKEVDEMTYDESDEKALADGGEGVHKQQQWLRQKQTNFPYYEGTVEFWFKSDIDQWDMSATNYDADEDTFYGGFLSANVLVQANPEYGIQGCQTYILREMKNVFRVTRVYFVDAIKGTPGGTTMDHWVMDDKDNEGEGHGEGHAMSTYIYKRGDTVPDANGLDANNSNDFEDLDTSDLGFIFARFDSWFDLTEVENDFKWRPHEWYHLAFSFRSDKEAARDPSSAINFFINGVYVDANINDNYPVTKMSDSDTSLWNTGTLLLGTKFTHGDRTEVDIPQKLGSIINEVIDDDDHDAKLVIGAIQRNQATDDQLDDWNAITWETEEIIHKEMFYFANGPFVAPCNGTMDSVRITSKYLDVGDSSFTAPDPRIQAFARYNTTPGDSAPELLGSYENGFRNTWGRDIRIANITWNEYRPKWDSAASTEILFDDSSRCELSFYSYEDLVDKGLENTKADAYRSYGLANATSSRYKEPFKAIEDDIYGIDKMGVAFPRNQLNVIGEDIEKFIIPEGGYFTYEIGFYAGYLSAVNSAAIFDELTVTILTPVEVFSFEEITE